MYWRGGQAPTSEPRKEAFVVSDNQDSDQIHAVDKDYLVTRQYRDSSNLKTRGDLHARFGTNPYPWFRWVFDRLLAIAPVSGRILEVGAGPAGLWAENLDRLPPGWRVTLTDLSEGMVTTARERLAQAGAPADAFTIEVADIEQLPYADASFDVAIANHMLYHVPDRSVALAQLRRILRPGGALLAATNGKENMRELDGLLAPFTSHADDKEWRASFRRAFTLENGAEQLSPFFDGATIERYEDSLRVTDANALIAYVLSIDIPALRDPEQRASFASAVSARMAADDGVFTIAKSVGAFTAHRS